MTTTSQVHAHAARNRRAANDAIAIAHLGDERPHPDSLHLYDDDYWRDLAARAGFDAAPYVNDGCVERRDAVVAAYRAGWEQPRGDAAFDGLDDEVG